MRKRFRHPEEETLDEPLINLTPLIDVVFVVLITFMLIAPVLNIDSVDLAPSGPSSKKETSALQNGALSIAVRADNTIWIDGTQIPMAKLEKQLREERKRHPKAIPQLIQDSRSQFGMYQTVKNALEAAGFEAVDIVLKPG